MILMAKKRLDIRVIEKKIEKFEELFKYELDYLWKHRRDEADELMSIFVKLRDKDDKGMITCITCWKKVRWNDGKQCNNAHFISREHYKFRWDPKNCHWACSHCNAFDKQVHQQNYTVWMIKQYWLQEVESMIAESKKVHKDPDIDTLDTIIMWLTAHIYQLKLAKDNTVILTSKKKSDDITRTIK